MIRSSLAILALASTLAAQGPLPDLGTTNTPEQSLRGRVTSSGQAVAGATVHVSWRRIKVEMGASARALETVVRTVQTDASGMYQVRVPAWRKLSAWAQNGSEVSAYRDTIDLSAGDVDLELAAAKRLSGRFVVEGKAPAKPIRFAVDILSKEKKSVPLQRTSVSKADGSFELASLPVGAWQLRTMLDERGLRPRSIQILENGASQEIDLVQGASASVRFVRKDGSPDPRVAVELIDFGTRWTGTSDTQGRIKLFGLQRGHGTDLIIQAENGPRRYSTLEPGLGVDADGPAEIEVRAHDSYTVEGRIFGLDSKPLAGIEVAFCGTIHGAGYPPADFSQIVKTDADGRYRCAQLDKNVVFNVYAIVDGEHQALGMVDPRPQFFRDTLDSFRLGSRRATVRVALPEAGGPHSYEVRAYGPKESAASNSYVTLVRGSKGDWVSPVLQKGEYTFVAFSKLLGFSTKKHFVRATSTGRASESLKLGLSTPRVLEGTVTNPSRKPLSSVTVALVVEGGNFENAPSSYEQSIARMVRDEHWPTDKFPLSVTTEKNGSFRIVAYQSGALFDLIAAREPSASEQGPPPARLTRALSLPNPITLVLR